MSILVGNLYWDNVKIKKGILKPKLIIFTSLISLILFILRVISESLSLKTNFLLILGIGLGITIFLVQKLNFYQDLGINQAKIEQKQKRLKIIAEIIFFIGLLNVFLYPTTKSLNNVIFGSYQLPISVLIMIFVEQTIIDCVIIIVANFFKENFLNRYDLDESREKQIFYLSLLFSSLIIMGYRLINEAIGQELSLLYTLGLNISLFYFLLVSYFKLLNNRAEKLNISIPFEGFIPLRNLAIFLSSYFFIFGYASQVIISHGKIIPVSAKQSLYLLTIILIICNFAVIGFNQLLSKRKKLQKTFLKGLITVTTLITILLWSFQLYIFGIIVKPENQFIFQIHGHAIIFGLYLVTILCLHFLLKEKLQKVLNSQLNIAEFLICEDMSPYQNDIVLDVQNLKTIFHTEQGIVKAVQDVSFQIKKNEILGLVGETGCGKSVTALSIMQLVRPPGKIIGGKVIFDGKDLLQLSQSEMRKYRGNNITMIFQDPMNSLNPLMTVRDQLEEVFLLHQGSSIDYDTLHRFETDILTNVGLPNPEHILKMYPHELSGGMRQRVMIAMGLACNSKLLICDEPTTALDVTIQTQILNLITDLKTEYDLSILFITHDLGVISKICDRVAVMYSGNIVEKASTLQIFNSPRHPYTKGLINAIPKVSLKKEFLSTIPGSVPNLIYPPEGCRFHPRCPYSFEPCNHIKPAFYESENSQQVACHLYNPEYHEKLEELK